MTEIFLELVNMGMAASWLIGAVLLLRLLLRKAPKSIHCFLWCLVGIRLLIPFSIESVFSLVPNEDVIPADILDATAPAIDSGIDSVNRVVNPILAESFAPNPGDSVNPLQIATKVASCVWGIGVVALLLYTFVTYLRLKMQVREAVRLKGNIYQSERVVSPFILGFVKPCIYIPFTLKEEELGCVIAHEMAHIKRRDHLIKPIAFLILAVYWFHPLVWLAYILLCRDIELACDEKVMQQIGVDKKKLYSETLLNCSVSQRTISACPIAFGEVGVKHRIKNVLNYKKPTFWIVAVSVLACVVCIVCFMTEPKEKENAGDMQTTEDSSVVDFETVEILHSPPTMILSDSLFGRLDYFEVTAGTYSWQYKDGDMMTGVEASGSVPQNAVKGQKWLQLISYNQLDYVPYTIGFSMQPDCVTVREYDLLELGDMDAEVISETVYEEEVVSLPLKARRIYEIIAEWDEDNLEDYGCYGTAYYAFATDNYIKYEASSLNKKQDVSELSLSEKFTEEVNNFDGVTMIMEKYKATEGDVEFFNDTDKELQYGDYYDIQIQKDGEWYSLRTSEGIAYHAIAYGLAPGTGRVWQVNWEIVYGALPVGNYRIVKDIIDYRAPGDYTKYYLAAEFEIMEK